MPTMYEVAMSIGMNCQTARHLRAHLNRVHGIDDGAYFFDWFWRDQGLAGATLAIERDFALSLDEFEPRLKGTWQAYHSPCGLYFTHDFGLVKCESEEAAGALMVEQFPRALSRYTHIADKTRRALRSGKNILLAHCGPLTDAEAVGLSKALREYGCERFTVLHLPFANLGEKAVDHPDFISIPIQHKEWPGDAESWAAALAQVEIAAPLAA